jgi:hypothetical protein
MGSLDRKGDVSYVGKDFTLATAADIVADPSAPNAFVEGVMESKEWVMVDGKFVEKDLREMQANIRRASSKNLQEAKIRAFQSYLSKIK